MNLTNMLQCYIKRTQHTQFLTSAPVEKKRRPLNTFYKGVNCIKNLAPTNPGGPKALRLPHGSATDCSIYQRDWTDHLTFEDEEKKPCTERTQSVPNSTCSYRDISNDLWAYHTPRYDQNRAEPALLMTTISRCEIASNFRKEKKPKK